MSEQRVVFDEFSIQFAFQQQFNTKQRSGQLNGHLYFTLNLLRFRIGACNYSSVKSAIPQVDSSADILKRFVRRSFQRR